MSFNITSFSIFAVFDNFFYFVIVIIQVFGASGVRKPPLGFGNKLLENFFGHGLIFNFLISQVIAFFMKLAMLLHNF